MDALNVKSALDLREEPNACKKAAEHNVVTGMAVAPIQVRTCSWCWVRPKWWVCVLCVMKSRLELCFC
jgi:hypothetical protein